MKPEYVMCCAPIPVEEQERKQNWKEQLVGCVGS